MRVHNDLEGLRPERFRRPAVTLGTFDGVHRGHLALVSALREAATATSGEAVLVSFDRHPREHLTGIAPPRLTTLRQRLALFERAGIDAVVLLPFDAAMAAMPAEAFVRGVLVERLGAAAVILGRDARFGHARGGDLALLERLGAELGFRAVGVDLLEVRHDGAPVSSSAIRGAISDGRLADARAMLGRAVTLTGEVRQGDRRGRTIGVPTANIPLDGLAQPPRGVYAGAVVVDGTRWPAMLNIGVRPTVGGTDADAPTLEVHLIGFRGDLYARELEVELLARLRDEQRFPSLDALKQQLARDREAALAAFEPRE
jgi:riboflavin kinase/FMN adenylyltransferase